MTQPKPSLSSFRYFLASLKPFGRPIVWGSIGIVALVSLSIWQYSQNPEWLGTGNLSSGNENAEGEVGDNLDLGVNLQDLDPNLSETPLLADPLDPNFSQPNGQSSFDDLKNPLGELNNTTLPLPNGLSALPTQPNSEENAGNSNQQKSPKFQPLIPSFKDLGSLFPPILPNNNTSEPIKTPEIPSTDQTAKQSNPLKEALENQQNQPSQESRNTVESNPNAAESPVEQQPQTTSPQPTAARNAPPSSPRQPYTNPYGGYGNQPYTNPYGGYGNQPYTNPYGGYGNQPYNNPYSRSDNQPYTQPYSNPYGSGSAPAPIPTSPQPSQSNTNSNNNLNPNPYGQSSQPQGQNPYGMQRPQVGDSVEQYGAY